MNVSTDSDSNCGCDFPDRPRGGAWQHRAGPVIKSGSGNLVDGMDVQTHSVDVGREFPSDECGDGPIDKQNDKWPHDMWEMIAMQDAEGDIQPTAAAPAACPAGVPERDRCTATKQRSVKKPKGSVGKAMKRQEDKTAVRELFARVEALTEQGYAAWVGSSEAAKPSRVSSNDGSAAPIPGAPEVPAGYPAPDGVRSDVAQGSLADDEKGDIVEAENAAKDGCAAWMGKRSAETTAWYKESSVDDTRRALADDEGFMTEADEKYKDECVAWMVRGQAELSAWYKKLKATQRTRPYRPRGAIGSLRGSAA